MKQLITGILFACFLAASAATGYAQDMPEAKKMENHAWHQVVMVKFKAGAMDDAKKIINDHFMKAGETSEIPGPQIMELKSGEWDMIFVWNMEGITDLDWEITPNDEMWMTALAEQEGGMEQATKLWDDYMNLIQNTTSYLATSQLPETEETMGSNR